MPKTSCLSHPENNPVLLLRADLLDICKGDHCAAMVLAQMEYWHNIKMDHLPQARAHNAAAIRAGETPTQNEELWVYKSHPEMHKELRGLFGLRAVGTAFVQLEKWGFLAVRSNPRNSWDKTKQYLLQVEVVNAAIHLADLQDRSSDFDTIEDAPSEDGYSSFAQSNGQNCETPKKTTKNTHKEDNKEHTAVLQVSPTSKPDVVVASAQVPVSNPPPPESVSETVERMEAVGVKRSTAQRLQTEYGSVACRQQLDWLPLRKADDPAAVLVEAIKNNYGKPAGSVKQQGSRGSTTGTGTNTGKPPRRVAEAPQKPLQPTEQDAATMRETLKAARKKVQGGLYAE